MFVKIEARILIFPGTYFHFPSTSVPPGTFLRLCRASVAVIVWTLCRAVQRTRMLSVASARSAERGVQLDSVRLLLQVSKSTFNVANSFFQLYSKSSATFRCAVGVSTLCRLLAVPHSCALMRYSYDFNSIRLDCNIDCMVCWYQPDKTFHRFSSCCGLQHILTKKTIILTNISFARDCKFDVNFQWLYSF